MSRVKESWGALWQHFTVIKIIVMALKLIIFLLAAHPKKFLDVVVGKLLVAVSPNAPNRFAPR